MLQPIIVYFDEIKRRGESIAIYVSNTFDCEICNINVSTMYEVLILKLDSKLNNGNYLIVAVYNPPSPNYNETTFIAEMSASILPLLNQHPSRELIIAGDFDQLDLHNLCASTGTVCLHRHLLEEPTHLIDL